MDRVELHTPSTPEGYRIMAKAGPLRNGAERGGGSIWHYVPGEPHDGRAALCGARPAIQWSSWTPQGQQVTCKKCANAESRTRGMRWIASTLETARAAK
jgi:hypothetical protein